MARGSDVGLDLRTVALDRRTLALDRRTLALSPHRTVSDLVPHSVLVLEVLHPFEQ